MAWTQLQLLRLNWREGECLTSVPSGIMRAQMKLNKFLCFFSGLIPWYDSLWAATLGRLIEYLCANSVLKTYLNFEKITKKVVCESGIFSLDGTQGFVVLKRLESLDFLVQTNFSIFLFCRTVLLTTTREPRNNPGLILTKIWWEFYRHRFSWTFLFAKRHQILWLSFLPWRFFDLNKLVSLRRDQR